MLLLLTCTTPPATDVGYLLHKDPRRAQSFSLPFGTAHVFYPEASDERCTAALLVDVDPIELVRGRRGSVDSGMLDQYVNDRPYAASSLLSVAMSRVFGTALGGRCSERPGLVDTPLELTARIVARPGRGGRQRNCELLEQQG
ncbi:MAG: 3' terminal RNA ribose 2'-O-methyltransferase Hen1, partial [Planctomycetota bacterium]